MRRNVRSEYFVFRFDIDVLVLVAFQNFDIRIVCYINFTICDWFTNGTVVFRKRYIVVHFLVFYKDL